MVNPVNYGAQPAQQATLNPFQKRIDDQVRNPSNQQQARENNTANQSNAPAAAQNNTASTRENQPPALQARNDTDSSRQQNAGAQRGSLLDVTV